MQQRSMTGLKKRQQIKNANKAMFLWVLAAAVAIAVCLVFGQFMVRQMLFNNKIKSAKDDTHKILQNNVKTFGSLKTEVNKLISDTNLTALRVTQEDTALQVIIDALPTKDDRAALATSLQQVVLAGSGVTIESINVIDGSTSAAQAETSTESTAVVEIPFTIILLGDYNQIGQALRDMEKTIRPLSIERVQLEGSGTKLRVLVTAKTYYLPAKTIENKTETIKP